MFISRNFRTYAVFLTIVCCFMAMPLRSVLAIISPRGIGHEERIKVINYIPNNVIRYVGHYTYQSTIEFEEDESVEKILMGTSNAWQMQPEKNRIFIKPIAEDAATNMTVMTNKRMYFFEMHAEYAKDINDPAISFIVKFIYQDAASNMSMIAELSAQHGYSSMPDLSKPERYNFKYMVSGKSKNIEPLLVFDDGKFTYLKFKDINSEFPAIFLVDSNMREGLVNYRVTNKYLVIERVHDKFTLRHGSDTLCVFNENFSAK